MDMPRPRLHVAIVGAGIAGLTAAIGIARAGHDVTVLEQTAVLGEIGAGIQIPPNSSRVLRKYGVLEKLEKISVRPKDFNFLSYRNGRVLSQLNLDPVIERKYGEPYLHIHRADYHGILLQEVQRLEVNILLGTLVVGVDGDNASVQIEGKADFQSDLVIGADGFKSVCRGFLLDHSDPPHLTGDLAYRIVINAKDMLADPELKALVERPTYNLWLGPHGHAVSYFLQGGELCNVVLLCPDNLPEAVYTMRADLQEMRDFFKEWDPRLTRMLDIVQDTTKWKLLDTRETRFWTHPGGKFTLMGDACHATLPYLAQGAAMAVEDAAVLSTLLSHIEDKAQVPQILTMYESLRKDRTTRVVQTSIGQRDIFHMVDGEAQAERDRRLLSDAPSEGFPNRWLDPSFQPWLFGYDAFEEAEQAWSAYKAGKIDAIQTR